MENIEDVILTEDGWLILGSDLTHEIAQWGDKLKVYKNGRSITIAPAGEPIDSNHPFIVSYDNICNGEPVILGTRVTVRAIVEYHQIYGDIENILRAIPHINRAQIDDALGYYADHKEEIDNYIAENDEAFQQKIYQKWITQRNNSSPPPTSTKTLM